MTRRLGALGALAAILLLSACGDDSMSPDGGLDATTSSDAGMDGATTLCAQDLDCSNSDFCDGEERCSPGAAGATPDGCLPGEAPCGAGEICDEAIDVCTPDDCVDEDGDGFTTCEGDCDDTRDDINPSTEETCVPDEATDEDCNPRTYGFVDIDMDGAADARCFNLDTDGTRYGGTDCDDNNSSVSPLAAEVCDGRFDENCDGTVDEDCPCTPEGDVRSCGPDMGLCTGAFQTCTPAGWAMCSVTPTTEVCDGSADENCDGMVDEGCECTNGDTRTCQAGICEGTERCEAGRWSACLAADGMPAPTPGSMMELCDGIDSDCDGIADADDTSVVGIGASCGSDVGECVAGTQTCLGSALSCVGEIGETTEVCDGRDNDCNGMVNDRPGGCDCTTGDSRSCGTGDCAGNQTCVSGEWNACTGGVGSSAEVCNGRDNDCDGSIDNVAGLGDGCGTDVGQCSAGTLSCSGASTGGPAVCGGAGYVAPATETCNHLDDDCDGLRDDGAALPSGCTRTFISSASLLGFPSSSPRDLSRADPSATYARAWSGDFGRSSFYRASFDVSGSSGWGTTLVLSPQTGLSSGAPATCPPSGEFNCTTDGLPPLAVGERAIAVQVLWGSHLVLLTGDASGWTLVAQASAGSGCTSPGSGMSFDIELFHTRGSFQATMRGDGCGFTTVRWDSPSTWTELYGERADFPRYNFGLVGNFSDPGVSIDLTSLYIDRRTSAFGADENCIGCM